MTQTGVETCQHCPAEVVVRQIATGGYRPFNRALVAADDVAEPARYVPIPRGGEVVMVLSTDLAPARLERVRWYATRHTCATGLRAWHEAKEARRMEAELAAMWGVSVDEVRRRNAAAAAADDNPDRFAGLHAVLEAAYRRATGNA